MFDGQKRGFDPSVERTEMERGVPKQRLLNDQVLVKQAMSLYFDSITAAEQFEDWYFNEVRRIDWFTMIHPYTGVPMKVRFEGGAIGDLVPDDKFSSDFRRDVVVEYLR